MPAFRPVLVVLLLCLLISVRLQAQEPELDPAMLWLNHGSSASSAMALVTDIDIEVTGMLAYTLIRQQFLNDSSEWAEGRYVFPLPDEAAVESLRIVIGQRVIEGEIQEREQARIVYEKARAEGRIASLVEQERANLFSTSIANIGPGEVLEVQIGFRQRVEFAHGEFRLRFPMSIAPPYVPGTPIPAEPGSPQDGGGWSQNTDRVPDASRITPAVVGPMESTNPVALNVELNAGMPLTLLESSHHRIDKHYEHGSWKISLDGSDANPHKDFELIWQPAVAEHVESVLFVERMGDQDHALLMLTPPEQFSAMQTRREVTLIIDTSGSMEGESLEQARQALRFALESLDSGDRFNLIEFNNAARALFPSSVDASAANVRQASNFVDHLSAHGGTEMLQPLDLAMRQTVSPGFLAQIVFVTDGQVGNTDEIVTFVRNGIGDSHLFTVGIGHGVNSRFLSDLARFGHGSTVLIADVWQVRTRMNELIAQLTSPVLHDIELHWPHEVELVPQHMPDLYTGQPLLVAARGDQLRGDVLVTGFSDGQPWQQVIPLETIQEAPGVAAYWGRQAIQQALDRSDHDLSVQQARQRVVDLAIEYQLLSPYTSLVAVDRTPERSRQAALRRHDVPGYRPDNGQNARALMARAMPATDAGSVSRLIGGLLALLMVVLMLLHPVIGGDRDSEITP
ncbi:MAG: marine proteobacterial sortase target protein [Pseudomonadota bacterium]